MSDSPVRVLVVDDQQLIREGIASLLGIQDGIEVAGTASDGEEALERAVALNADVVLMDIRMPKMDGVQAVAALRQRLPSCRVIMLTTFDDQEYVIQALKAGASGYLLKDLPSRELAAAIRLAHAGVLQIDPAAAAQLTAALTSPAFPKAKIALSTRETEILRLVAQGRTNREIARQLHLSEGTVKNHVSRILDRLGLRDRVQAALYARDHGII